MRSGEIFARRTGERRAKRPYIIAEAGVNHGGSLEIAKRLIEEAKEGGADAVKFQTYKAQTLASKNSPAYWDLNKEPTTSQFELFKKYDKFWKDEFELLKLYCDSLEIEFLSTPFDFESVKFLNPLMDVFKISSSDITNKPFIEYIDSFKKPIILSTGASSIEEIRAAVSWIKSPLALLHCVLNYPTEDHNANLNMIANLRELFPDLIIGYSDHTLPGDMFNLTAAYILGAEVLEKHFTHDKSLPGNDHYHAMDKNDLRQLIRNLDRAVKILGKYEKAPLEGEEPARMNARRSIAAVCEIKTGTVINGKMLTFKRPAFGISPSEYGSVIGKKAAADIPADKILAWDDLA